MPTGTPCVPHCDSRDLVPVNGKIPPTTSADALALCFVPAELAEPKAPAATIAATTSAAANATPIVAVRRLAPSMLLPPCMGDLVDVGPAEEYRGKIERCDLLRRAVNVAATRHEDVHEVGVLERALHVLLDDDHSRVEARDRGDLVPDC